MTGSTSVQSFGSSTEQRFVLSIAQVPFYHTRSSPDSIGLASGEIPGGGWCATCLYSYLLVVSEASLLPVDRDRKVEHAVMPGVVEDRHGNVYKHLLAIGAKPSEAGCGGTACPWFVECSESRSKTTLPCDPQSPSTSKPLLSKAVSQPGLKICEQQVGVKLGARHRLKERSCQGLEMMQRENGCCCGCPKVKGIGSSRRTR